MINNLSKKITKELVKRNILSQDDFELYHYGFFIALSDLWLLTFTIIVGILLKAIVLSLVFFFSFFLIRRFAGGFHAKTEWQCQIYSLSSLLLSLICAKYLLINLSGKHLLMLCLAGVIITTLLSPVDTYEKELSQNERKKFKSITFCIGGALLLLNYILFNFKIQIACTGITTAYLLESILLIFGKLFNKSKKRKALLDTEN